MNSRRIESKGYKSNLFFLKVEKNLRRDLGLESKTSKSVRWKEILKKDIGLRKYLLDV